MKVLAYRVRQLIHSLLARPTPAALAVAETYLPPALHDLFLQMSQADQAHSLRVLERLLAQGQAHPDLITAALLHDVGKVRAPLRPWERALVVLAGRFFPWAWRSWGSGAVEGWRRPFVVAIRHPEWGAEMVHQAGGSATAVELIRRHQERLPAQPGEELERLLLSLQAVDGAS